ncbi:MAG TPA: hypothetical protein VKA70_12225 [Blastocatellia bacterium]|nr:hypothetical protein [Blastocatellia bacterium]
MRKYYPVIISYLVVTWFTVPFTMGDTVGYADAIVKHRFQDFGHYLWYPLGWAISQALMPMTRLVVGPEPLTNVTLTLVIINWLAGLLSVFMIYGLASHISKSNRVAYTVTLAFIISQGFLAYAQSGCSYVPGLSLLLLGLFLLVKNGDKPEQRFRAALFAGLALAGAVCLWFTYVWSIPAALAAPLFFYGFDKKQYRFVAQTCAVLALAVVLVYGAAAVSLGINSVEGLKNWVTHSSHGITGLNGAPRMVFGLSRSFINMGNDGALFKAYLVHDPFNPVSMLDLLRVSLWKLALFYVFLAAILFNLLRSPQGRRIAALFAINAIPVLLFAILWEGGAIERYLLLYPLIFIALAYSLSSIRSVRWLNYAALAFVAVAAVSNIAAMARPVQQQRQQDVVARISELEPRLRPESRVATVNQQDEVWAFSWTFPFNPLNSSGNLNTYHITEIGTSKMLQWREDFAEESLSVWDQGGDMWLSERVFAARPLRDWNWVEGADQRVSWTDINQFFSAIEVSEVVGERDGFVRVLPTDRNRALLGRLARHDRKAKATETVSLSSRVTE